MLLCATALVPPAPVRAQDRPPAPTFTVFATREGLVGHRTANGHRIRPHDRFVALPSWTVLASDGGQEFQVRVTYRGRSVVLPVWDVGPWNTHDEYWSPNRRYGDLPVGKPMAQAAYEGGYSGAAAIQWYDASCGQGGRHAWTYGTPDPAQSENRASWAAQLPGVGFYEALAYIPPCGRPATQSAHYHVAHDGAANDILVNQEAGAGNWVSLGIYQINNPAVGIELSDVTGDEGRVVRFDAVKWLPRSDSAPPQARVTAAVKQADGSVLVRWGGADDVSGIAAFDVQVRALPDGGWSDWQVGAIVLEAAFVPPRPGGYAFRARAVDWLGHQQPWRDGDDLQVQTS